MRTQFTGWMMGEDRKTWSSHEAGQALVLIVFAAIALVAIMGLAIDGGRLLFLRRDAQNANDASVMAATFALCTGSTDTQIRQAAYNAATSNGFIRNTANTTVEVKIGSEIPNAPANTCLSCSVQVEITREIPSYFIQIVYSGALRATTKAIGSCNLNTISEPSVEDPAGGGPRPPMSALFVGSPSCDLKLAGSDMLVAGHIHSNGGIDYRPNNQAKKSGITSCEDLKNKPPSVVDDGAWTFGDITYSGSGGAGGFQDAKAWNCDWDQNPNEEEEELICGSECLTAGDPNNAGANGDKDPVQVGAWLDTDNTPRYPIEYDIAIFKPGGTAALEAVAAGDQYYAASGSACANGNGGMTSSSSIPASYWVNGTVGGTLKNGIYYSPVGWNISHNATGSPNVTFVSNCTIKINGTVNVKPYYGSLLFFANGGVTPGTQTCSNNEVNSVLQVSSSNNTFEGIIYVPNGQVQFSAAANNASVQGCILAYDIDIQGSDLDLRCEPNNLDLRGTLSNTQ